MKTLTAFLLQAGVATAQAAAATQFFTPNSSGHILGNTGIQIGAQFALLALQGFIAHKNSNSDPNGNPLVQNPTTGNFQTSTAPGTLPAPSTPTA